MTEGRVLAGVEVDVEVPVSHCRSCGAEVWWGRTAAGKRCPFDVQGGQHTAVSHFSTCPDAKTWTKK